MAKKVLAVLGSARKKGNSALLLEEFIKGAAEAGNEVERLDLTDYTIGGCRGCNACQVSGKNQCVQRDGMDEIGPKLLEADVYVLATPVYYYGMTSQMKAMIDRTFAFFMQLENKEVYMIAASAAPNPVPETAIESMKGFTACLPNCQVKGTVMGGGCMNLGDVKDKPTMREAYEMGKTV